MANQILVDKDALFKVLKALTGPQHILNEMTYLQKCDDMIKSISPKNPIDILINDYEESVSH